MKRFRFISDDDGHVYIIPADEEGQFHKWLGAGPYWKNYKGKDYSDLDIGGSPSCYSFTDPQEDK